MSALVSRGALTQRAAANADLRDVVQRRISINGALPAETETVLAGVRTRAPTLNPLHVRSVIFRFDHDGRQFASNAELDGEVTTAVAGMAAQNITTVWADNRLEAITAVSGTEYTFTMSYKHLRDTYSRGDREYGAPNNQPQGGGNTIQNVDDATALAQFEGAVSAARTTTLVPAAVHPHRFPPQTTHVGGGVTFVTEGTRNVHVYPTSGASTLNISNDAYYNLVVFSRWASKGRGPAGRGDMVANQAGIVTNSAAIQTITGYNVATEVQNAVLAHALEHIRLESVRIGAADQIARNKINLALGSFNARVLWRSGTQRAIAQSSVLAGQNKLREHDDSGIAQRIVGLHQRIGIGQGATLGDANILIAQASSASAELVKVAETTVSEVNDAIVADDEEDGEVTTGGLFD